MNLQLDHIWIAARMALLMLSVFIFLKLSLFILPSEVFVSLTLSFSIINIARTFINAIFENQGPVELAECSCQGSRIKLYTNSIQAFQIVMIICVAPLLAVSAFFLEQLSFMLILLLLLSLAIEILTPNMMYHSEKRFLKLFLVSSITPMSNIFPLIMMESYENYSLEIFAILKLILIFMLTIFFIPEFMKYLALSVSNLRSVKDIIKWHQVKINYLLPSKLILTLLVEAPTLYLSQFASPNTFISYEIFRKITEAFKQLIRIFNVRQLVDSSKYDLVPLARNRSIKLAFITTCYAFLFAPISRLLNEAIILHQFILFAGVSIIFLSGISGSIGSLILLKQKKLKFFFYTVVLGLLPWISAIFVQYDGILIQTLLIVLISEALILFGRTYYAYKI